MTQEQNGTIYGGHAPTWPPLDCKDERTPRIVAKSIHRVLTDGGLKSRQLLSIATELLGLVSADLRRLA